MTELTGKCIACGKRFAITPALMQKARNAGCAISPCCNFPSTLVSVEEDLLRDALRSAVAEFEGRWPECAKGKHWTVRARSLLEPHLPGCWKLQSPTGLGVCNCGKEARSEK